MGGAGLFEIEEYKTEEHLKEGIARQYWEKDDVFQVEDIIACINLDSPELAAALKRSHERWKKYPETGESVINHRGYAELGGGLSDEESLIGMDYFSKNTGIGKTVWGNDGKGIFTRSWAALRYIDENIPTSPNGGDPLVDYAILNSAACTDVRQRKELVKKLTHSSVRELLGRNQNEIIIDNMGSGEGDDTRYVLKCLYSSGIPIGEGGVKARCFDISNKALKSAAEKARHDGLLPAMEFHKIDILDPNGGLAGYPKSDIELFIGLPDYFDNENFLDFAGKGYGLIDMATTSLKPGGVLYTANIAPHDIGNHSIMGTVWWHLHERDEEYFIDLIKKSGLEYRDIHTTDNGVFNIVKARKYQS